jgi:hypothetical protein
MILVPMVVKGAKLGLAHASAFRRIIQVNFPIFATRTYLWVAYACTVFLAPELSNGTWLGFAYALTRVGIEHQFIPIQRIVFGQRCCLVITGNFRLITVALTLVLVIYKFIATFVRTVLRQAFAFTGLSIPILAILAQLGLAFALAGLTVPE